MTRLFSPSMLGSLAAAALLLLATPAQTQETTSSGNLPLGSAANLGSTLGNKGIVTSPVGDLSVVAAPAAATAAVATVAAGGPAVRHVATNAIVCISPVAAQPDIVFNLRDGGTGAGTVKAVWRINTPIGQSKCEYLGTDSAVVGSLNTAMTLESATAPAATNFATATLIYHDAQ